MLFARRK